MGMILPSSPPEITVVSRSFDPTPESEIERPNYAGYAGLMAGLAQRGFVAVSINANDLNCTNGLSGEDFLDEGRDLFAEHIDFITQLDLGVTPVDPFGGRATGRLDAAKIVLGGHSRGGDRALLAANTPSFAPYLVGVVSVAQPWNNYRTDTLTPFVPVQMLYGTRDGDVLPYDLSSGAPPSSSGGPIRQFDQMSVAGFGSLHLIDGANHKQFNTVWSGPSDTASDFNEPSPSSARIDGVRQRAILRDYAVAFSEAVAMGSGRGVQVVSGDLPIRNSSGSYLADVRTAYREAGQFDIDDHANNDATVASYMSSPVMVSRGNPYEESLRSTQATEPTVHHDTDGLYADDSDALELTWDLSMSLPDLADYTYFSVRVGRVANNSGAQPSNGLDAFCAFEDSGGYATSDREFTSDSRARAPNPAVDWNLSFMETIRFPMACLAPDESILDRSSLATFSVRVEGESTPARIVFDDPAFQGGAL